jgi:hypothetical protein
VKPSRSGDFEFCAGQGIRVGSAVARRSPRRTHGPSSRQDAVVREVGKGVNLKTPVNLDPTRRSSRVRVENASGTPVPDDRRTLTGVTHLVLSAEAVGIARRCTESGASYACEREQFGRQVGSFQAVNHHCADRLVASELATSAGRGQVERPRRRTIQLCRPRRRTIAAPAADLCANLSMSVHGGISVSWDHDAHLFLDAPPKSSLCSTREAHQLSSWTHPQWRIENLVYRPPRRR